MDDIQIPKLTNIEQLQSNWDKFSELYGLYIDKNFAGVLMSMANMLKIHQCDSILEVAVGTGIIIDQIMKMKKPTAKLTVTDLSPQMCAITKKRIETYLQNPFSQLCDESLFQGLEPVSEKVVFEQQNVEIQCGNSENLSEFKDESFDAYYSNLCLMLTVNHNNM